MTCPQHHHHQSLTSATTVPSSSKDRKTRSLLLTRFGSKVRLTGAAPTPGLKSILKVTTLVESLNSTERGGKRFASSSIRASESLAKLGKSIRHHLFGSPSSFSIEQDGGGDEEEDPTMQGSSIIFAESTTSNQQEEMNSTTTTKKQVRFTTIEQRLYSVAPSDNPGLSGKGPALELDGWTFELEQARCIEEFEVERTPKRRTTMEDLKMSMMDRQDRLREHGASNRQIQQFANRVQKAKIKRAETVEAFSLYGKQHLIREEKRENTKRWFQKLFRLRQHHEHEQVALWEQAQQKKTRATTAK